jgi:hypothetical protein
MGDQPRTNHRCQTLFPMVGHCLNFNVNRPPTLGHGRGRAHDPLLVKKTIAYPTFQEIIDGMETLEESFVACIGRQLCGQRFVDALEFKAGRDCLYQLREMRWVKSNRREFREGQRRNTRAKLVLNGVPPFSRLRGHITDGCQAKQVFHSGGLRISPEHGERSRIQSRHGRLTG